MAVPILELKICSCRWPIERIPSRETENGDVIAEHWVFCGERAKSPRPYCAAHAAIAYAPQGRRLEGDEEAWRKALREARRGVKDWQPEPEALSLE